MYFVAAGKAEVFLSLENNAVPVGVVDRDHGAGFFGEGALLQVCAVKARKENVGKSQPVLIMINPIIFTRTRTVCEHHTQLCHQ